MTINTSLKEQIFELREKGLSYNKISEQLSCSKSTISYHCNPTSKQKTYDRSMSRKKIHPIVHKIDTFKSAHSKLEHIYKDNPKNIRTEKGWVSKNIIGKISIFESDNPRNLKKVPKLQQTFTYKNILQKSEGKCYLTGRTINFILGRTYNLDHVIPRSKGGLNTFDNCEVACKEANQAKSNLSKEEFFQLCIDVVKHNNLKID